MLLLTKYLCIQDWSSNCYAASMFITDIDYFVMTHKELNLIQYKAILQKHGIKWGVESMSNADAEKLDAITILALLVAAYRADHFCEGTFDEFVQNGSIQRWLDRLSKISPSC